jgi:hypothetical protein
MPRVNVIRREEKVKRGERKLDPKTNPESIRIEEVKQMNKGKVPLRVNDKTIIMVSPENRNAEYAHSYRERLQNNINNKI